MNLFRQVVLIVLAIVYLAPAQAMLNIDSGIATCRLLAEENPEDGKKKDGKKEGGESEESEEEEPECD